MTTIVPNLSSSLFERGSLFGATLVASEFDDSNILIWGSRGCTSQVVEAMALQRQQYDYYHFPVTEADLLTNGLSTLKKNLLPMLDGIENCGPFFLFLSDSTLLTNEDLEGFIEGNIRPDYPLIFAETGFKGKMYYGINEAIHSIFKRFATEKVDTIEKRLNIIPAVGLTPDWRGEAREVARIMSSLGYTCHISPCKSSIEDIQKLTEAEATLLVNPNIGEKAAQYLKDRFNIPYFSPKELPIGLVGVENWLNNVADFLDVDSEDIKKIHQKELDNCLVTIRPALREENYNIKVNKIKKSKFIVCDEYNKANSYAKFLVEEVQFDSGYVFYTTNESKKIQDIPRYTEQIDTENFEKLLEKISNDDVIIVLAADCVKDLIPAKHKDKIICVSHPATKQITFVEKTYLGYNGVLHLLEKILNTIVY